MRILIVEDDAAMAAFLESGLKAEGYAMDIALDGETGLRYAFMNDYDLILLDIRLPKMSGYEICKAIRAENSDVPILFLTGISCVEDKVKGLNLGGDDYITKPFHFEELAARVRAAIRRHEQMKRADKIEVGELVIDIEKHEVRRAGQKIQLSFQEYNLLAFLASKKNKMVSRTSILTHVWQDAQHVGPSVVDVHINHLRNKIDKDFPYPMIHTVRGMGYILQEAA